MDQGNDEALASAVNKLGFRNAPSTSEGNCTRCGWKGHKNKQDCPALDQKCIKCRAQGHYARCCQSQKRAHPDSQNNREFVHPRKQSRRQVNCVAENTNEDLSSASDDDQFGCFRIKDKQGDTGEKDGIITCRIGGVPITMLIDSGSSVNVLTKSDWSCLKSQKASLWDESENPAATLKPYAATSPLLIRKSFHSTIGIQRKSEKIAKFFVVDNGEISLLGKTTAIQLGVLKIGLSVNQVKEIVAFPKIKNVQIKLAIDKSIRPVKQPLRRVAVSVESAIENKLKEAVAQDIIEPVTRPSEWISPILVLFKKSGEIRICVDMRRANEAIARENYPLPTFETLMTKLRGAKWFTKLDLQNAYHQLELHADSREITTFITHVGIFR